MHRKLWKCPKAQISEHNGNELCFFWFSTQEGRRLATMWKALACMFYWPKKVTDILEQEWKKKYLIHLTFKLQLKQDICKNIKKYIDFFQQSFASSYGSVHATFLSYTVFILQVIKTISFSTNIKIINCF